MAGGGIDFLMTMHGGAELRRKLRKMEDDFLKGMKPLIVEETAKVMREANAAAPSVSGTLIGSAMVVVKSGKTRTRGAATYQDEKAAAVHEGVHWNRHVKGTRGFKWLERTFNSFLPGAMMRIEEKLRAIVQAQEEKGGGGGAP